MDHDEALRSIRASEAKLLESYEQDLADELALVDAACALLLAVLARVSGRGEKTFHEDEITGELSGDTESLRLMAQLYMGIRTLRTIRAGRAVLAFGYEREAPVFDRILLELQAHSRAILKDASGSEALKWLRRERRRRIGKRVASVAPKELTRTSPRTLTATLCRWTA